MIKRKGIEDILVLSGDHVYKMDYTQKDFIAGINQIRREIQALQSNQSLWFHAVDNEEIICYSKHTEDSSNIILVVVNLNPHYSHSGWVHLPTEPWELDPERPYQVHDLVSGARYLWHGADNYVELNPAECPVHIFRVQRRIRQEQDFDYYM